MNQSQRLLRDLLPPEGGWQRLLERRDVGRRRAQQWLALVAGGVVTALLLGLLVPQPKLDLRWPGSHGAGAAVVLLDEQRARLLPTDDPGVRLYWREGAAGTAATSPRK